ncbi:hypothetical protein [Pectobacterium wasabiae]|uniref:Uncharacterized protein n=1 Tax=Pectobacterium wasabiae TaxID=55208 RepID=A0AAW3EM49_9GAMM|nr:hypothetical protein [Pectobacterium wasabiae]AOR64853.1 hypothetical protein A7983_16645 [Pectobacterium wasabiae CFBP 3304]EJS96275.1 Hypothetical protein Y17_0151 [Pectobacterium wasabiae CFBP 3304]KFX09882.1 hypothetical protein JV38_02870 [Pectobacterium wasabiae]KGA30084.1 hypothetical protein KU73_06595 [Pectobacterium wasabiae]
MYEKYLDVRKVIRCVEHKKKLDEVASNLKKELIDSMNASDFQKSAFSLDQNTDGLITLKIDIYDIEITFKERLIVINDVPLLKFTGEYDDGDCLKETTCFFLGKNALVYVDEYKPNPSYDYNDSSLFLEITASVLKSLKSVGRISY